MAQRTLGCVDRGVVHSGDPKRVGLGGVTDRGGSGVGVDMADVLGGQASGLHRTLHRLAGPQAVGRRSHHVVGVRRDARTHDPGQRQGLARVSGSTGVMRCTGGVCRPTGWSAVGFAKLPS